jgi:hypothetical protein
VFERPLPVGDRIDDVPRALERSFEYGAQSGVVLGNQHPHTNVIFL